MHVEKGAWKGRKVKEIGTHETHSGLLLVEDENKNRAYIGLSSLCFDDPHLYKRK